MSNFLQSEAWARFQRSLGHEVFRRATEHYSYLAVLEGGRTGRYLYCPYGPEADSPEAFDAALAELKDLARQHRCLFVRVEPTDPRIFATGGSAADAAGTDHGSAAEQEAWASRAGEQLRRRGLFLAPRQIQPSHTWMVDLEQEESQILAQMSSSNRNRHRNIHKKGVAFHASQDPADIAVLNRYLAAVAEHTGFNRQKDDYLAQAAQSLLPGGDGSIWLATLDGEPIGASFVYDSADTRVYAHTAVDYEHRRLGVNGPLVTAMILDAKQKGLKRFDMFGIAPEGQPDHEWAGFTDFKKSFGGFPVTYPGTWDLPVLGAPAYRAFTAAYAAKEKALPFLRTTVVPRARQAVHSVRGRLPG